jgi:DNA-binding GntR family transcriptional regulator/predicted GIY-YIG superfamily endonuclease
MTERTALYRLYDADDRLLYVGISNDPPYRLQQHAADKAWWHEVDRHTLEWVDSRQEALDAERLAISTEHPRYNHTHKQSSVLRFIKPQRLNEMQSGAPWTPHQVMAAELRGFVQSGSLRPGDRFPTVGELVAVYGVSNVTVQRALGLLKSEGFAQGRMGSGVYATLPPGFRHEKASQGLASQLEGVIELLPVNEGRPSAKLCQALGIERGATTRARSWIRRVDDVPVELVEHYDHPDAQPSDSPRRAFDLVSVTIPTTDTVIALRLPKDAPILVIIRTLFADDDRVIAVQRIEKSGHLGTVSYQY